MTIKEENLDWESRRVPPFKKKDAKIAKAQPSPLSKEKKVHLNDITDTDKKSDIKKESPTFLDEHPKLFFTFSILIFPYIVGFLVTYFIFYYYGGMTIDGFINIQTGHHHFELWSIGIYLSVAVGMIWIVLKSLFLKDR